MSALTPHTLSEIKARAKKTAWEWDHRKDVTALLALVAELLDDINFWHEEFKFPSYYVTPEWREAANALRPPQERRETEKP